MSLLVVGGSMVACSAMAGTLAVWTEATGAGPAVRAIVTDACPALSVDGKAATMDLRAAASGAFPVTTCQAVIPNGAQALSIDGRPVPLPGPAVKRIVVLGDTGCRLKKSLIQDCDDPAQWPFAEVARSAAAEHPDLVIHVGDYYYRETPCPADHAGCAGSPHGDAWPSWAADFFTPASPLLATAPWIFVRGNHEQCGRGAAGWFRFLDAGPMPLDCPAMAAPFTVPVGDLRLYVLDSADTEDQKAPADKVALFRGAVDQLRALPASGEGWILTHRPIWGFSPPLSGDDAGEIGEGDELPVNLTEQAAVAGVALGGVQLVLSGHVHIFATASFGPARPAQLIVGNGGDTRDGTLPGTQSHRVTVAGLAADAFVAEQFGYLLLDRTERGWQGTLKHADGTPLAMCSLAGRVLACRAI